MAPSELATEKPNWQQHGQPHNDFGETGDKYEYSTSECSRNKSRGHPEEYIAAAADRLAE